MFVACKTFLEAALGRQRPPGPLRGLLLQACDSVTTGRRGSQLRLVVMICLVAGFLLSGAACQQPTTPGKAREGPPRQSPTAPSQPALGDQPPAQDVMQDEAPPPPPAPPEARQLEEAHPAAQETDPREAEEPAAFARRLAEARPKRPAPSWVIFREAFDDAKDAACTAEWTGGNRLEVHTENIRRITLDLHRLPGGAPQRGPWNLQLDGQGVQITGFRGKVLDLVRSKNGNWTVDRSKFKE